MNIKKKMKVTASKRIQAAVTDSYDFTDRVKFGKNRYRIMYTGVNTEGSAKEMFNNFRFQISVSNPYDDADYAWCYGDSGVIKIIKSQKVIHKAFYFNADDMDVENTEWCDEVVRIALSELEKINGRIEQRIIHNSRKISADATVEDDEDDIKTVDQEYDSANTSINSTKLPAIYNMVNFPKGAVVLDYGGGKFDNAVAYLDSIGCKGYVYDPYNRSAEHNREVIKTIRANGGADITLCSNVLNVIKEPEARKNVLENIKKLTKPSGKVYITVYEGKGDGAEGPTKSGYQLNRKTAGYVDEVKEVFPEASRKGKLICASYQVKLEPIKQSCKVSPKHIKSSRNETLLPEKVDWYELDWDEQIQLMKKYVRQYKGSRIFEDFAEYINAPVEDIIDSFCDAESYGDIKIPERMQLDSEYRNDDIYSTSRIPRSVEGSANKVSPKHIKSSRNATFQNDKRLSSTSTNVPETQMIDDLEYFYEVYPEAMEPILIRNGATPDKDNWLDGCNIPQAYNEAVAYFESKYDNDDEYSELDTGVGSRLGWSNYIQSGIYEELDSDDYGGAYYVEVNSTRRGTAPYEKKFSDFNSALSFAKKRGNSKTTIYIWDIPKEERSSNSVPNAVYDFDSGWQIIRPVGANEDDEYIDSSTDITASSKLWMGKYKSAKDNKMHKVYFEFDTSDFEEAEQEFEDIIPEPYSYARLLGTAPHEALLQKDGFEKIQSSSSVSSRYWYFTRHGVQPGSVPKYVNILDIVDKPEGSYFLADGVILTNDLRDYDIKERKPEDSVTSSTRIKSKGNDQYTDADLQDIAEKIEAVVVAVMMQDEGFDESESKMYSRVTISDIDDNGLYIEVGAEVGYESLERICSECDKVIQALPGVDEDSYFEPIDPGLAGCYIIRK